MKYLIKAKIEVDGIVDKHDVIGALFGQTEGLLSPELDLRELQDKGRIGRIIVDIKPHNNKVRGEIRIPSNLDRAETALLAALIETVDKVGPYSARIQVTRIIDMRLEKLKKAVERAKEILRTWQSTEVPDLRELLREIEESTKPPSLIEYGPEKLPAGPEVEKSDTLIIVEGRADVINLMRYGYYNTIAIEGARGEIPKTVKELARKKKRVIAFVDGDHAGDLILEELLRSVKVDYVARAPPGREVEDLSGREIARALNNATPAEQYLRAKEVKEARVEEKKAEEEKKEKPKTLRIEVPEEVIKEAKKLQGTLEALIYDKNWKLIDRVPVRDLYNRIKSLKEGEAVAIIFDGIVTQRILDVAAEKGITLIAGARIGSITKRDEKIGLLTIYDLVS